MREAQVVAKIFHSTCCTYGMIGQEKGREIAKMIERIEGVADYTHIHSCR